MKKSDLKYKIYLLFICLIAAIFSIIIGANEYWGNNGKKHSASIKQTKEDSYLAEYEICITQLMDVETLFEYVTTCPAGYKTIGYGHKLGKLENYTTMGINEAKSLLIADFDRCIRIAKRFGYKKANNKQLAVAHAIFCLGEGRFKRFMDKHDFFYEICQLNGYFCGNKFNPSRSIQDSRNFEIQLFYYR